MRRSKLSAIQLLALLAAPLGSLQGANWILQDRWLILGPIENLEGCPVTLPQEPFAGHSLARECPGEGDDWFSEDAHFLPGALTRWTSLASFGRKEIEQEVRVDFFQFQIGIGLVPAAAGAVVYANNRLPVPLDVLVQSTSDDVDQVWINDRVVTQLPVCRFRFERPAQSRPAVLRPGKNKIAVAVWSPAGNMLFQLRLAYPDGRVIDDRNDPNVEFTTDPTGCVAGDDTVPVPLERTTVGVNACRTGDPAILVRVGSTVEPAPGSAIEVVESLYGDATPSSISDGGTFLPFAAPGTECPADHLAAVGVFEDHLDIGSPCIAGDAVQRAPDRYAILAGGHEVWSDGDQLHFAFRRLKGDFRLEAKVASRPLNPDSGATSDLGKFGLMVRQDCSMRSRYAFIHDCSISCVSHDPNLSPPDSVRFAGRPTHGSEDNFESFPLPQGSHPAFQRMERIGNRFIGSWSEDGAAWNYLSEMDWGSSAPCEVIAGIAVTSLAGCKAIEVEFQEVRLSDGESPCGPPSSQGGTIHWTVPPDAIRADLSYELRGRGLVRFSGHRGEAATTGTESVVLDPGSPPGPDFDDAFDIGLGEFGSRPGSTGYDPASGVYTQTGSGFDFWDNGDSTQFAYRRVEGDFDLEVQIIDRRHPELGRWGRYGLMARQDCTVFSRYTAFFENSGKFLDDPLFQCRAYHGAAQFSLQPMGSLRDLGDSPAFIRLVRKGNTFYGFFSLDGVAWTPWGAHGWRHEPPAGPILAGFFTAAHGSNDRPPVIRFKVLGFGPLEEPLGSSLPEDRLGVGAGIFATGFDGLEDFETRFVKDGFEPHITGGRLRLQDSGVGKSTTSAFSKYAIGDIDGRVYEFDFDVFLGRGPVEAPGDGITFTVAGGKNPSRIGAAGSGTLGYFQLGVESGATPESPPEYHPAQSFSVEFDAERTYDPTYPFHFLLFGDGPGSPLRPGAWHLGIDTGNVPVSVALTSEDLPDIFDPAGVHARVRYNRGRVTVWLKANRDPAEAPLRKYLETDVLPLSYLSPDSSAVFGFTAGSSDLTMTAEVDNLRVVAYEQGPAANWRRCDVNGDGAGDVSDPVYLLAALFTGAAEAPCRAATDCNSDEAVDLSDAIFDLSFQFLGGPKPADPFPACGAFEGCGVNPGCR